MAVFTMSSWAFNESGNITQGEMENNALIIDEYFSILGWSKNAIAALLGNMEPESGINPARWENDDIGNPNVGYGLVQWTPATKLTIWISNQYQAGLLPNGNYKDGTNQLDRIKYEIDNNLQYVPTKQFKETFQEWSISGKNPGYLAAAFMVNYEKPLKQGFGVQIRRAENARRWYQFLTGNDPGMWLPVGLLALMKKAIENRKGGI